MARSDWDISGVGSQVVKEFEGSKVCELVGTKNMLWNGKVDLIDSEILANMRPITVSYTNVDIAGVVLRSDANVENCYMILIKSMKTYRRYSVYRVVNSVSTIIDHGDVPTPGSVWEKYRFRADVWQLSIERWENDQWNLVGVSVDDNQTHALGYTGIICRSASGTTPYGFLFDLIDIGEKI